VQLAEYFSRFGEVIESKIVYSHENMKSRGFGFVVFRSEESVDSVLQEYSNHYLQGRWIECKPALLKQELSKQSPSESVPVNPKPSNRPRDSVTTNRKKNQDVININKLQQKIPETTPTKKLTQQKIITKNNQGLNEQEDFCLSLTGQCEQPSEPKDSLRSSQQQQIHLHSANSCGPKRNDPKPRTDMNAKKAPALTGKSRPSTNNTKPSKKLVDPATTTRVAVREDAIGHHSSQPDYYRNPAQRSYHQDSESGHSLASRSRHFEQTKLPMNRVALESGDVENMHSPVLDQQIAYGSTAPTQYYPSPKPFVAPTSKFRHPFYSQSVSFEQYQPLAPIPEPNHFGQPLTNLEYRPNHRYLGRHNSAECSLMDEPVFDYEYHPHPEPQRSVGDYQMPGLASDMSLSSQYYCQSSQRTPGIGSLPHQAYFRKNYPPSTFNAQDFHDAEMLRLYQRPWETNSSAYNQSSDAEEMQYEDHYVDSPVDWLGDHTLDCTNRLQSVVGFQQVPDSREYSALPNTQMDSQYSFAAQGVVSEEQWEENLLIQKVTAVHPDESQHGQKARLFNSRTRDENELTMPEKSRGSFKSSGQKMEIM
jgi:RNA recognition motif-containing protein